MSEQMVNDATAERAATIVVDGLRFRDLDHDGRLAPYEDWRLPVAERVADLLGRMTLDEKLGTMLHGTAAALGGPLGVIGIGDAYDLEAALDLVHRRGVTSMITRLRADAERFAEQNDALQAVAASGRLGIPITVSSDPRHHLTEMIGASVTGDAFTKWPETLGLAAIGDADLVRRFGDCVRREYRAVGIHMSLAPQADLATSPRWPRIEGTFGEDPALVRTMVGAYVDGVQGGRDGLHRASVAAVVKHWVGYGASRDGFDGHNWYGRHSAFPAGAFDDHVSAFLDAFAARVAGVMPTYNILEGVEIGGVPVEPLGAGFSRVLVDGLLRSAHGFSGLVLSDWGITRDITDACRYGEPPQTPDTIAMPWGVDHLPRPERFGACINAGVDQIGGEDDPVPLAEAVAAGLVAIERVDAAVRRVLTQKFELGLFDSPFVEPAAAPGAMRDPAAVAEADAAQRRAVTVLAARRTPMVGEGDVVLATGPIGVALAALGVTITDDAEAADVAVVAIDAPHEMLHPGHFFGRIQHEGDLDWKPDDPKWRELDAQLDALPTVVVVHLDRPAVLTRVSGRAEAVVADLGATPSAIADVLTGRAVGDGRLPFRLFASMDAVLASPCDRPSDAGVLFAFGHRAG